jgi:alpha-1,6-mannosyltransferase
VTGPSIEGARFSLGRATLPPRNRPNARLTVLDVTKWFGETSGGVKTYLMEKGEYVRRNPELRQVLALPGPSDSVVDTDGVRTYRLRGPRIPTQSQYRFLLATRSLRRIVEHERPDIIEVGSQIFVPWVTSLATRGLRMPIVSFYHGNFEHNVTASLKLAGGLARAIRALTRRYIRAVDRLFTARLAASDSIASDLRAAGIGDITRVRLGVDTATFHPDRRAHRDAVRRERGLPVDHPIAVYCGRIAQEKEIPWLVRSWTAASAATGTWLVLIGDGALKASLEKESRAARQRIIWLPFECDRARLADVLACADVYVAPGPIETFGLSILEAMSCGAPVVSVDCGAGAELARKSGGGLTYRIRDEAQLGSSLSAALSRALELGARGRRYALQEHGWDHAFDELFAIYDRLRAQ